MSLGLNRDLTLERLDAGVLERKKSAADGTGYLCWSDVSFLFRRAKVLTRATFTRFYVADNRVTSLALIESDHASLGIKVTVLGACAIGTTFSAAVGGRFCQDRSALFRRHEL
jgi:hypothetical protein